MMKLFLSAYLIHLFDLNKCLLLQHSELKDLEHYSIVFVTDYMYSLTNQLMIKHFE